MAGRYGALIFLIVLCVTFAVLEPAFLNTRNIFNVIRQVSIYGLLAIGMTFVILTAGIDLSIGSTLALAGLVCAAVRRAAWGCWARRRAKPAASVCRRRSPQPS